MDEAALRARLDADPNDTEALEALVRLYTSARKLDALVALVEEAAPVLTERKLALSLLLRGARVCLEALQSPSRGIALLQQALADDDANPEVLALLAQAYERVGDWVQVADIRSRQIAFTAEAQPRVRLQLTLAAIYQLRLDDPARALDVVREVLEVDPNNREALAGFEALATRAERWDELVTLLQRRAALAETPRERVGFQRRLAQILAEHLADPFQAAEVLRQALEGIDGARGLESEAAEVRAALKKLSV